MKITTYNQIAITKPTAELLAYIRANYVVDNPDYVKKVRLGKWVGNTPEKLYLYEMNGDEVIVPYGCLPDVIAFKRGCDAVSVKFRQPRMIWYGTQNVPLYDYQREAVQAAIGASLGIIQAPAGSGKTQVGVALAKTLGRKTLWLTHTSDLLHQSKERAERYMDKDLIGTITEGKVNIGRGITFATVQTMYRLDLSLYKDEWDVIITDECHRVAGSPTAVTMFSKVLNSLAARHKYGLSATVHRADGLIQATYALIGEVVHVVEREEVAEKIVSVNILPRTTRLTPGEEYLDTDGTIIYSKLINWLAENDERNEQIASDLVANADHYNLILSDRLSQLRMLMEMLPPKLRGQAVMIDGKMQSKKAKAERYNAIEDMREGRKRYLFATYQLAKEGLDIPRLDRLYLATPQKDPAVVEQAVGRIARAFDGKDEPVCYDYVDSSFKNFVRMYKRRCTTYRKLGYPFIGE